MWGLRHYSRLDVDLDPTSPYGGRRAASLPDDKAVGFGFSVGPFERRIATLTYLSANTNVRQVLQDYLSMADAKSASPREFQIRFRQPVPEVTEGSVTLAQMEALERFLFGLMAMLGHTIYV